MKLQLKRIRKEKKLSQTQLADMIGANLRTIGAWERGETMMSIEQLCRCCEILGSTPNEMTGWYIEHPKDRPAAVQTYDPFEQELVGLYRSVDAKAKSHILDDARGQRELSLKTAEDSKDEPEELIA